ncbi:MAG: DNA repair protein RadC [Magnetococcales bacterium]|nr:DNA repair protein RadC [Magnetococcales bacterium]
MGEKSNQLVHQGHRDRLRQRFLQEGLEHFNDHQVLELVLFSAQPRKDTNQLAHLLLKRFGSLSNVLEADPADLTTVTGIGRQTAVFLGLIPALTRRFLFDRALRAKQSLDTVPARLDYITPLMSGRSKEVFYVICLDSRMRLIFPALISEGTARQAVVQPRDVVEAALRHQAVNVILAHNHPSGNPDPSPADISLTRILQRILIPIDIGVTDHLIVAGEQSYSMAANGLLGH